MVRDCRRRQSSAQREAMGDLRPALDGIAQMHYAARAALYGEFVQAGGLYWATFNDVVARHETARRQVVERRRSGAQAEFRLRPFAGEGTLTAVLQRRDSDPLRTPAALADARSKWRNIVRLPAPQESFPAPAQRRSSQRQMAAIRIGSTPERAPIWQQLPIVWHRPLPADADVAQVQLTRRRVAGRFRVRLSVTCRLPQPPPASTALPAVAWDFGWRSIGSGELRAAVWASERPLSLVVPDELTGWLRLAESGDHGEVVVPVRYRNAVRSADTLRSRRAQLQNTLRAELVDWSSAHPRVAQAMNISPLTLAEWRTAGPFLELARRWQADLVSAEPMAARLQSWQREERRLWQREANTRDQIAAQRKDVYAKIAHLFVRVCGDLVLAPSALKPRTGSPEGVQERLARRQRSVAAVGLLRGALQRAAARDGHVVRDLDMSPLHIHHGCGGNLMAGITQRARSITLHCPGQRVGRLTRLLLAGTLPGVVAGSVVRVELLPGPRAFQGVIAVVLHPSGCGSPSTSDPTAARHMLSSIPIIAASLLIGAVGGIYGIGGGSIVAPILISTGYSPREVAPATLAATWLTSLVGVATFILLGAHHDGSIAPDWGDRHRLACGRAHRQLPRCASPTPLAGASDPPQPRGNRHCHWNPLRLAWPIGTRSPGISSRNVRLRDTRRRDQPIRRVFNH
jgi:hypothetical protein